MAVIRDKNTGEPIAWTADDPIAKREGPSPQPYPGEAGSTMMRSSEYTAGKNLDQAEMAMNGSKEQVDARPSQKWTDEYGTVWSSKPPEANLMTIQDDMGNTITFDKTNPNPESTSAYSTDNYGNDAPVSPDQQYQDNQDAAAASDAGNMGSNSNVSPGMNEDTLGTSPTTTSYTSTVTEEGNSDNLGTTPTDIGTGQVVDNAVANSGDLSFGGSALTNNSDLNSSVGSSLGGVTSKGEMFSGATEAAGSAASADLTKTLGSIPGGSLSSVMGSIPGLGPAVGPLAKAGNIAGLAGALSKGLSPSGIQGMVTSIGMGSAANLIKGVGQVSNFVNIGEKIGSAAGHATMLSQASAGLSNIKSTVSVNGTTITTPPPPRPDDIIKKAAGDTADIKDKVSEARSGAAQMLAANKMGMETYNDDGGPTRAPGMPVNDVMKTVGAVRQGLPVVPGMEALMFGVKAGALAKFSSLLPPTFKSLLPIGAVAGLVSKGPLSLGGLTQLVGGAALGAVAGQALRSVGAGTQGLGAVSGMTGLLGAQALARTVGTGSIPVNIASTYGNAMLSRSVGSVAGNLSSNILGTNPSTTAMIANVVGVVSNVALNKNIAGIPVSSQVLGLAANVALRSAGVSFGLPTSVLGTAASFANNPLSSLVGSLVGGRVPIIPTNLSLGNVGALSGLTQSLQSDGIGLAENIIPRSQLQGLLPGNLQNQIPTVPERMRGKPGYRNETEDRNAAATRSSADADLKPTGTPEPAKPPLATGRVEGKIDYNMKISKHLNLGQLSGSKSLMYNYDIPENGQRGLSADKIIENLSTLAVNVVDHIIDNWPGYIITNGFRGPPKYPPGKDNNWQKSHHGLGCAVDISWGNGRDAHHKKICEWIVQKQLTKGQIILEYAGGASWVHISLLPGDPNHSTWNGTKPYQVGFNLPGGSRYA